ncbi:hypothetical protein AB0P36_10920 [Streptomyces flavidovirens]|uniref:hypothetical protein n=1 Tax=Streptomyces flavidovirens TaxID=67298 RepID=UPI0034136A41
MDSKQYRERAEKLLNRQPCYELNDKYVAQAAVWAQLATAAAMEESAKGVITDGE